MVLFLIDVHRILRAGQQSVLLPLQQRSHLRKLQGTKAHVGVTLLYCGVYFCTGHLGRVRELKLPFPISMHGAMA